MPTTKIQIFQIRNKFSNKMGAGQKITCIQQIWKPLNMKYPMYLVHRIPKEVKN